MAETAQTLTMAMLDNAPEFVLDVLGRGASHPGIR